MAYKRAQWHSGLTYRQTCEECGYETTYKDNKLGFRPWYPEGFVYCERCKTPLRHREIYAIDDAPTAAPVAAPVVKTAPVAAPVEPLEAPTEVFEAPKATPTSLTPEFFLANNPSADPDNEPTVIIGGNRRHYTSEAPTACESPAACESENPRFCTQCGKKSNPGDRFCSGCGTKLA